MQIGWVESKLEDHPGIFHKQDGKEFALFIKKYARREEICLIRTVAEKFGVRNDLHCDNLWRCPVDANLCEEASYMWIRKSALADVENKMGFKFGEISPKL